MYVLVYAVINIAALVAELSHRQSGYVAFVMLYEYSPPFATVKAGDDFPFRKPSTPNILKMPKMSVDFLKKLLKKTQKKPGCIVQPGIRELLAII